MKRVLLLSTDKYPDGDAGAVRQASLALLFASLGYEPLVVGLGKTTPAGVQTKNGIKYVSLRSGQESFFGKAMNYVLYWSRLRRLIEASNAFDVVLVATIPLRALFQVRRFCTTRGIQLVHDSVEWYSPSEFRFGRASRSYLKNELLNSRLIGEAFRVIAISRYLEQHFAPRTHKVCRIPAVLELRDYDTTKILPAQERRVLTYAGLAGRKDHLREFLIAATRLGDTTNLSIRIIGATANDLVSAGIDRSILTSLSGTLSLLGRRSRAEVLEAMRETDFTVMFRDADERYAKAGFPTKFVESMATGTPMILNLSSDLGEYCVDGREVLICRDSSAEAILPILAKAMSLSRQDISDMRMSARRCAENNFDVHQYSSSLALLLE